MSERERWIVYPLLFLALGAALRDKLLKQTIADQVVCKQLVVRGKGSTVAAVINDDGVQADRLAADKIEANLVDSQQLLRGGQPVAAGGEAAFSASQLWRVLQYLQQVGALSTGLPTGPPTGPPTEASDPPGERTIRVEPVPDPSGD